MKKKDSSTKTSTDFEKLQKLLESKFDSLEKQIRDLEIQIREVEHNQKISDQKNDDSFKDLRFRLMAETSSTRQELEKTLRAEILVANTDLKSEIKNELQKLETRLNKRLTHVADLITIQLGDKIQNHEKRILKLENTNQN